MVAYRQREGWVSEKNCRFTYQLAWFKSRKFMGKDGYDTRILTIDVWLERMTMLSKNVVKLSFEN